MEKVGALPIEWALPRRSLSFIGGSAMRPFDGSVVFEPATVIGRC